MYPNATRQTLLARVKMGDEGAWNDFYKAYRGLVWLKGSDYNLTEAEQQDLLSDVMNAFFNIQGKFIYDPSKGKFRFYFRKLVSSFCLKIIKKRMVSLEEKEEENPATSLIVDNSVEEESANEAFEWRVCILRQAIEEVKRTMDGRKVQCFIRCKLKEEAPVKVAKELEISLATVYNYCNEVLREVKALALKLEEEAE